MEFEDLNVAKTNGVVVNENGGKEKQCNRVVVNENGGNEKECSVLVVSYSLYLLSNSS